MTTNSRELYASLYGDKSQKAENIPIEPSTQIGYPQTIPDNTKKLYKEIQSSEPIRTYPEENTGEYLLRGTARTAARAAEAEIGIIDQLRELVEPKLSPSEKDLFKQHLEKIHNKISLTDRPVNIGGKSLLERTKEAEKSLAGEYLEPRNENEKEWDEFVSEATPLMTIPGSPEASALRNAARGLISAGFGHELKNFVKYSGGSEGLQEGAKLAGQIVASIYNPGGASRRAGQLYKESENAYPLASGADARKLEMEMDKLIERMESGTSAPSEKAIADEARKIKDKIINGELTFREAIDANRSINEKSQAFLYSTPDKAAQARARNLYKRIQHNLQDFIGQSESKFPEAYKKYMAANEMFGTVAQSRRITEFIGNKFRDHPLESIAALVFGLGKAGAKNALKGATLTLAGYPIYKSSQIAYRMMKSPELRNYYFRALRQATQQNGPELIKTLNSMKDKIEDDPELSKFLKEYNLRSEYSESRL